MMDMLTSYKGIEVGSPVVVKTSRDFRAGKLIAVELDSIWISYIDMNFTHSREYKYEYIISIYTLNESKDLIVNKDES